MKKILEELVQVIQDTQSNTTNAPEQTAIPMPRAEVVNRTTIKQFQTVEIPNFSRNPRSHNRGILAHGN